MPTEIEFPYVEAVLEFPAGHRFHRPLVWPEFFALYPLGDEIRAALALELDQSESTTEVLLGYAQGEFEQDEVVITREAKAGLYPDLQLTFRFIALESPTGTWLAFVPHLGVIAVAAKRAGLDASVREAIQMEFKRRERWSSVPEILASQWSCELSLTERSVTLSCFTLADLREKRRRRELLILEEIAEPASEGDAVFGLNEAHRQLERSLRGGFGSSILVVGPPGVGKTALLQSTHAGRDVWRVTATELLHRLMAQSEGAGWEGTLGRLCHALAKREVWLQVGNLLEMFEIGRYVGNTVSVMEYMRPYIERGEVRILAECTEDQLALIEARYPGFVDGLRRIRLTEPEPEMALMIIRRVSLRMAEQQKLNVDAEAVDEAYRLHWRYAPYSGMPGQVIRFLSHLFRRLDRRDPRPSALTRTDVIEGFCEYSGMPPAFVDPRKRFDVEKVEAFFADRIKGQAEARRVVVERMMAVKSALSRPGKPIATLLFVGPTGVGKTETAKALAEFMFSDPALLIRFDMSEYSEPSAVLRLVGDGVDEEGLLTTRVRQQPFGVILFDEIEKADPSFFDFLLQIAGEGRLTDSRGRVVDFCGSLIIMTSNLGAADYGRGGTGFLAGPPNEAETLLHFQEAVRAWFRPEMFNRLDEIVPFHALDHSLMESLLELELAKLARRRGLEERALTLDASEHLIAEIAKHGHEPRFGARHLQRALRDRLVLPVARHVVSHTNQEGGHFALDRAEDGAFEIAFDASGDDRAQRKQVRNQQHEVTRWRRAMQAIIDGPGHVQVINEWDWYKRELRRKEKKKQESILWKDPEWVAGWQKWRALCIEGEELLETISVLEDQIIVPGLNSQSGSGVDEQAREDLGAWIDRQQVFCHRLFNTFHENDMRATLGVFGAPEYLGLVAGFYLQLLSQAFPGQVQAAWVVVGKTVEIGPDESPHTLVPPDKARAVLIETRNDQDGANALAYLKREDGMQSWAVDKKSGEKFVIEVQATGLSKFKLPPFLGRKALFKDRLERRKVHYAEAAAMDRAYQDFAAIKPYDPDRLKQILDQLWQQRLRKFLTGQEDV